MSVNKVILLGNVGSDPTMRFPEPNMSVAYLSLATSERQGTSGVDVTEWHNLVMTGRNAELAERYVRKGTKLYVEGKLRTREYDDKFKIRRKRTEIIVEKFEILGRSGE